MTTLSVAVVGSGPAGLYTAEALVKQSAALDPPCRVAVDVLDRLPTPYGLVRYGVAPDHPSIKSIAEYLRGVLERDDVRFLGGVRLGGEVTREDLLACYDAVVYATGAMRDRRMGIDGEDLPGSYAATDFVNWYCGHPDSESGSFTLDAESVAVVGGPAQAKFTTKELRELGELAGVDIVVGAGEAAPDAFDATGGSAALAESDRRVRGNLAVIGDWAARVPAGHRRRLVLRFWLRPVRVEGTEHATGLTVERTRIDENGSLTGTGELETIPAQMVLRSVGYQSVPLPGVPFDERSHTVPNAEGRVLGPDGAPLPREYVAGWLKRGPTGVIGTNKSDAAQTVRALLADLCPGGVRAGDPARAGAMEALLAGRAVVPVSYDDWLKVERAEAELAASLGRGARVKLASREDIDARCRS